MNGSLILDDEATIDRAFPIGEWQAPTEVELTTNQAGALVIRGDYLAPSRRMSSTRYLLSEFLLVRNPEDVQRFARAWGLLGRPFSGSPEVSRFDYLLNSYGPEEKVADWLSLRAQVDAILRNAARVLRGEPLDIAEFWTIVLRTTSSPELREEWESRAPHYVPIFNRDASLGDRISAVRQAAMERRLTLDDDGIAEYIAHRAFSVASVAKLLARVSTYLPGGSSRVTWDVVRAALDKHEAFDFAVKTEVDYSRLILEVVMQELLEDADVRPLIRWDGDMTKPAIEFGTPSRTLFAALCLQVATAFCRSQLTVCDGCGSSYTPKKWPRRDRANYCPRCQANGASRLQAERNRQRKKKLVEPKTSTDKRSRRTTSRRRREDDHEQER